MSEHASLARARTCVDDGGGRSARDGSSLVVVEFGEQRLRLHGWQATTAVCRDA